MAAAQGSENQHDHPGDEESPDSNPVEVETLSQESENQHDHPGDEESPDSNPVELETLSQIQQRIADIFQVPPAPRPLPMTARFFRLCQELFYDPNTRGTLFFLGLAASYSALLVYILKFFPAGRRPMGF